MNRLACANNLAALALVCALPACYLGVEVPADSAGDDGTGAETGGVEGDGDGDGEQSQPFETTRFARLSHGQWENTVRDLFALPAQTGFSDLFIGDPSSGKFDNDAAALDVTPTLWADYQRAAEQVADYVTADALLLAAIVPDDLPDDAGDSSVRAKAWIEGFGARAYRRPLTSAEVDAH